MLTIDYSDHHIPFGQSFIQVLFASKDSVCEEKKREYFSGGKGGGGIENSHFKITVGVRSFVSHLLRPDVKSDLTF